MSFPHLPARAVKTGAALLFLAVLARLALLLFGINPDNSPLSSLFAFSLTSLALIQASDCLVGRKDWATIILPILTLTLLLTMETLLATRLFGASSGIEEAFSFLETEALPQVKVGQPTTPTMVGFLLLSFTTIAALLRKYVAKFTFAVSAAGLWLLLAMNQARLFSPETIPLTSVVFFGLTSLILVALTLQEFHDH